MTSTRLVCVGLGLLFAACSQPSGGGVDAGPQCTSAADCSGGQVCLSGACQPCSANNQCPAGKACLSGACGPCTAGGQCTGGLACVEGACGPCAANADCSGGQVCGSDLTCGTCTHYSDCDPGQACLSGACGACTDKAQCGTGRICLAGVCGNCTDRSQCAEGQICGGNGLCAACVNRTDCAAGEVCVSGKCGQCTANTQCAAGKICLSGVCSNCSSNTQCSAKQACVNGTCGPCTSSPQCGGLQSCVDGACYDPPTSCKDVQTMDPGLPDGPYQVDPDGYGAGPTISVYCDMTNDGGGWTLAANFVSPGDTNGIAGWTDPAALGSSFTDRSVAFKLSDADINRMNKAGYRLNGYATTCATGACTVASKAFFEKECVYQSDGLGDRCGISYSSPMRTNVLSWFGSCGYGLSATDCGGAVWAVAGRPGGHAMAGNGVDLVADDAVAGQDPKVEVWVK